MNGRYIKKTRLILLRHAATAGNIEKLYVGTSDEELLTDQIEKIKQLSASFRAEFLNFKNIIYVSSPMKRCIQTLELLLPSVDTESFIVENDFREMNFGRFEYKSFSELSSDSDYQKYIDSNGESPFPDGEDKAGFTARTVKGFYRLIPLIKDDTDLIFCVVHGGTIMAILDRFSSPHKDYFDFQCKTLCGYIAYLTVEKDKLPVISDIEHFSLEDI